MARKDVDLVIRAKDEAESVVRAITKALNDFNSAQKDTEARSEKTDSALGKLGASFASLNKVVGSASVGAKIAEEMDRASAASARLKTSTAKTIQELTQMKAELAASEASLASLTAETERQAKAQADQVKAIAKSKSEYAALKLQINSLDQATKGLLNQQTKLPETISKQEAAIAKTAARLNELNAAYASVDKPGKTLTDRIAATNTRLVDQQTKLSGLKTQLAEVGTKLGSTGESMAKLSQKAGAAGANLAKQTSELASIKKNYSDLSASARSAAQSQVAAAVSVDKLTGKLTGEVAQLEVARVALSELGKAAGYSNDQLAKLTGSGIARLQASLTQQKAILAGAKEQYAALSGAAVALEENIGRAGVPTRKMSEDLAVLKAQVSGSKVVMDAASLAFVGMSQSFRTGEKSLAGLEQTEKAFVVSQGQMSSAIQKTTADYQRNLAAIKSLHSEQARNVGGGRAMPPVPVAPPVGPWNQLSQAFNKLYGDSRKSLSITQRLRGEVLSLIAAYGGFYGVVNLLSNVLGAYQKLEAAQARLNVANNGSLVKSAEDMDFLRRTADRLGVDLGTLAQEYSKFSIATLGTNLAGEKTRKIFLSVAEAARVNRSSTEEISGVFVALTQIVSKGAVQMEELRQQLGDRLPGALSIMADGLGVTTAELIKMMQAGQVTSDALVPFAEELDRRFGPGLGEALAGTTVALGKLKNAAFQTLVQFGKGGFVDSFTELANKLTSLLKSADFGAFIDSASSAFGVLVESLGFLVSNFKTFVAVVSGFIGLKLAPVFIGIASGVNTLFTATKGAIASQLAIKAAIGSTGSVAATASVGVRAFSTALSGIISSTAVGLAITAVAAGIGYWAASADTASEAMTKHKEIVDLVRNAYEGTKGVVDDWQKSVGQLSVTAAKENLNKLKKALEETQKDFKKFLNFGASGADPFAGIADGTSGYTKEAKVLFDAFVSGKKDVVAFRSELDKLSQKYDTTATGPIHRLALVLDEVSLKFLNQSKAIGEAEDAITSMTDTTAAGAAAFDRLGGAGGRAGNNIGEAFKEALDKVKASAAQMTEAASKGKVDIDDMAASVVDLEKNYRAAVAEANKLPEAIMRAAAQQDALNAKVEGMTALYAANQGVIDQGFGGSLVDRIIQVESGGNANAKNPNSSAQGLGQFIESTWIRMFKQYFPDRAQGMTNAAISALRADADLNRQMVGLYLRENAQHLQKAGVAITDANLYLSHFLGPDGAVSLLSSAPGTLANNSLSPGQVNANKSVLDGKTREEVIAWAQRKVGISKEELGIQEHLISGDKTRADEIQKTAEAAIKAAEDRQKATSESISDAEFEIEQQKLINAGKEQQAAIEGAIRAAKKANPQITDEEINQVARLAAENFKLAHAKEAAAAPAEAAKKAEELVNNLLSQRNSLQEQFNIAQEAGDTSGQEALKEKIKGVNEQLMEAILNAEAMWKAVGGPEADAAIAKLEATRLAAQHFSDQAKTNYTDWKKVKDMIVDGLAGAFDNFAQRVADGQKPLEALRDSFLQFAADFLIQIAQMIIKQAIFNALQSAFGGTSFGSLIGLAHTGGVVGSTRAGSGNGTRRVSPGLFAGAPRYHVGGVVGLRPGEVPIIAKKGEEVLTQSDPRNILNGGSSPAPAGASSSQNVRIVNGIDSASFLEAALASPSGEKVILNWMRANADSISSTRG